MLRKLVSLMVSVLAFSFLLAPLPGLSAAQPGSRFFAETGYTVQGKFLAYWESHGGLAQQGYPLSDEFSEISQLDGKSYTVQYFERAVFELHPENAGTPYEVLLSLLGVYEYQQRYSPAGAFNQRVSTDNPRYFPETGHTVGGKFRAYWERNGGLAQQGYPLSDELTEVSTLDGKPYTVQYFERAVFELHPENAGTPHEVLLTQLGTYQYRARYQAGFAIPAPWPNRTQQHPRGNDNYLVWTEIPNADLAAPAYLRAVEVGTNRQIIVSDSIDGSIAPALAPDGSLVAWVNQGPACPTDCNERTIQARDLATGATFTVGSTNLYDRAPAVAGHAVAWVERQDQDLVERVLLKDLTTNQTTVVATGTPSSNLLTSLVLNDDYLIWSDAVSGGNGWEYTVRAYDRRTGQTDAVAVGRGLHTPLALDGRQVVWSDNQVHWVDLASGAHRVLADQWTTDVFIQDNVVIWSARGGDLWGARLSDTTPRLLAGGAGLQVAPTRAALWLIWQNDGGVRPGWLTSKAFSELFAGPPVIPPAPRRLAAGVDGGGRWAVAAAGPYLAYLSRGERDNNPQTLILQNTVTGETISVDVENYPLNLAFALDSRRLVWTARLAGQSTIFALDLQTRQVTPLVTAGGEENRLSWGGLAVDGDTLYYTDRLASQRGLIARDLTTGQEQVLGGPTASDPVAAGGTVVWRELVSMGSRWQAPIFRLYVRRAGGPVTLVAESSSFLYDIAGDQVVWTADSFSGSLNLYNLTTGTSRTLVERGAVDPQIRGNTVVWAQRHDEGIGGWSIQARDLTSGATWTVVPQEAAMLHAGALLDGGLVAYTDVGWIGGLQTLYLTALDPDQ